MLVVVAMPPRRLASGCLWVEDKDTAVCMRCADAFSFPLKRKHHCRWCGKIYCGKCAPDPVSGVAEERLCVSCKIPRCFFPQLTMRRLINRSQHDDYELDATHVDCILSFLDDRSKSALLQSCKKVQSQFHVPAFTVPGLPAVSLPYISNVRDRFPKLDEKNAVTRVGKGGGGTVHLVEDTHYHCHVAVKIIEKGDQWGFQAWKRLMLEVSLQNAAKHPNIARIFEAFQTPTQVVLAIQAGEGKTLRSAFEHVRKQHGDMEVFTLFVTREIIKAIKYLFEDLRVIHRDIKPDNIVLSRDYSTVMLIDFGLAERVTSDTQRYCPCGTKGFASPENIAAVNRSEAKFRASGIEMHESDVFSMGVVAYILLSGARPFRSLNFRDMQAQLQQGIHCTGPRWDSTSRPTKQLIEWMLHRVYTHRATPTDVLSHESMGELDGRMESLLVERRRRLHADDKEEQSEYDMVDDVWEVVPFRALPAKTLE